MLELLDCRGRVKDDNEDLFENPKVRGFGGGVGYAAPS